MTDKFCEHVTADEIREMIHREAKAVGGIPTWCKLKSVGTSFVYEVLRGTRLPSSAIYQLVNYDRVILGAPKKKKKE